MLSHHSSCLPLSNHFFVHQGWSLTRRLTVVKLDVTVKLNKHLCNTVNNKERRRGQRSVVWLKRGQPCLVTSMYSVQRFPGSHSLRLAFGSFFCPHPTRFILPLPLINQCDRCQVPLAWGLMAGERGFASHRGVTLSRGWLCQRLKPLDRPGTHLH